MLTRHLRRLTRSVPLAGSEARAIAVYAEALSAEEGDPERLRAAGERGFEGVACVDDAARAVVLSWVMWHGWRREPARAAAVGLLRFLAYMQDDDGRFANFIVDWQGHQNTDGVTSARGGLQWQARATHALACGVDMLGGEEWEARFQRGIVWLDGPCPYLDVRAVGVLASLTHWQATRSPASAERALAWAVEIAAQRREDGALLNAAGVDPIHLWGHLQETALARTGQLLGHPDLVEQARASADALLAPAVASFPAAEHLLPFDVSCVVSGLVAVARATGEVSYAKAADRARAWLLGRNAASQPVYDRARGLVYDGIDAGRVSRNAGAESNIEGALALLGTARIPEPALA